MTQPNPDVLLELEHATANKAVKPFLSVLKRVLAMLAATWPGDNADPMAKEAAVSKLNLEELLSPLPVAQQEIIEGAVAAFEMGTEVGIEQAAAAGVAISLAFKQPLPSDVLGLVEGLQRSTQARLVQARGMLREAATLEQAIQAVALANPQTRVEAAARSATNKASNKGLNTVADNSPDIVQLWVAERDGCVDCLAYQGQMRLRGGYPGGLTFGKKPLSSDRVPEPPLHPNCRCTQMLIDRESAPAVAAGLKREAQRSILRGWAVESERESVRVDAARRLLAKQPAMPKSVQAYARKAVAKGAFARGKNFPGAR